MDLNTTKEIQFLRDIIESDNREDLSQHDETINNLLHELTENFKTSNYRLGLMEVMFLKGSYLYQSYRYNEAITEYTRSLEYALSEKQYSFACDLHKHIGASYYMLMMLDHALLHYSKSLSIANEHNTSNKNEISVLTVFNKILCYRKLNRNDMVLRYISYFKAIKGAHVLFDYYIKQVIMIEGNTYRDLKLFSKAEEIYLNLLGQQKELDDNTLFLVYDNYIILCMEVNEFEKALHYIDKALELKNRISDNYLPWIYLTQTKCLMTLNRSREALKILNEGLPLAKQVATNEMIIDFQFALVQAHIVLREYEKALIHLQEVEKFILDNNIKLRNNDLYSFYAEACCGVGEVAKGIEYMSKVRKDYLSIENFS